MANKYKNQAMAWLNKNCEDFSAYGAVQNYGVYMGRRVRVTDYSEWYKSHGDSHIGDYRGTIVEIGDDDFDRWANSVAVRFEFDKTKPFMTQFSSAYKKALLCQN